MLARCLVVLGLTAAGVAAADGKKPLTPVEARTRVGEEVTVEMEVRAVKDRLEKRGEVYLDAEPDFKDPKNFAVVITRKGAASFKEGGVADPADHFNGKTVRARGVVKEVDGVPRIEVDEAKQLTTAGK